MEVITLQQFNELLMMHKYQKKTVYTQLAFWQRVRVTNMFIDQGTKDWQKKLYMYIHSQLLILHSLCLQSLLDSK